jgi:hypothetical protein
MMVRPGDMGNRVFLSSASCGRSLLNSSRKASNLACCCSKLVPAGRVASFLSVKCAHGGHSVGDDLLTHNRYHAGAPLARRASYDNIQTHNEQRCAAYAQAATKWPSYAH